MPRHHSWHERKGEAASCVTRATAKALLAATFKGHLRVFTDGSVSSGSRTWVASYAIPQLRLDWSDRLADFASSSTPEVVALAEALRALA